MRNDYPNGFATVTRELDTLPQEALSHSEQNFELLVQSVRDYAILLLDPEGRITSWNMGAQRIKGYTADEIIGRSFVVFYPEEARASGFPQYELKEAARTGRFEDENWRLRKDGSRFWANVIITALFDTEGKLIGYAKVTRDLTERRASEEQARRLAAEKAAHAEAERRSKRLIELNRQLSEANDELQAALLKAEEARQGAELATMAMTEAYRQLDQFAYVASHDLKAPLRGIGNLAQWIQDDLAEQINADTAEHLRLLQGRVCRMEALIDGILAYSRAGRVMDEPEPVDAAAVIQEVIELIAPSDTVTIRVAKDMPVVQAERVPLQQVFMNLITNAVKHSVVEHRDPEIAVEWRDAGDSVEFLVRDNGPGISPEYHERIWNIFQTLAPRDKVEGTGVGLSVVKKIVESRGGSVSLESSPGEGACFGFTWPKLKET